MKINKRIAALLTLAALLGTATDATAQFRRGRGRYGAAQCLWRNRQTPAILDERAHHARKMPPQNPRSIDSASAARDNVRRQSPITNDEPYF